MQTATLTYQFYNGSSWVDLSTDVEATPYPTWSRGFTADEPDNLVAAPGQLTISLNNSASNSAGKLGYYTPGHANAVSGFDLGTRVRVKSTYSASNRYQLHGRIKSIKPIPFQYGPRRVEVVVGDYMTELAERNIDLLALQSSKTSDQLLTTLIASVDIAPLATSYDTGPDTFSSAFYDLQGEKQTPIAVAQRIAQSDLSRLFVRGDTTGGETLVLANRHNDVGKTSQLTLSNTMEGMEVTRERDFIFNKAIISIRKPIEGTSNEVLYTLPLEKSLSPGKSWSFTALFRDPDGGNRLNGKNMVTPVVDTDYKFSSTSGSGNDLNSSLGVNVTFGSDRAEVTVTNNHASQLGYMWFYQLRGLALRLRDPLEIVSEDSTSQTAYGERVLRYSAAYQSNENSAKSIADFLVNQTKDPRNKVSRVSFTGNKSAALMSAAVNLDIGDAITPTETVTAISGDRVIIGRTVTIRPGGIWDVEYLTKKSNDGNYWILGTSGASELGVTTYLGF